MTVTIYISDTLQNAIGHTDFTDTLDGGKLGIHHGSLSNGGATTVRNIAVAHTHTDPTLDCDLWFRQLTAGGGEAYAGSDSPVNDFDKLLSWGDDGKGIGVEFNWFNGTTFASKLKTGVMDNATNSITIPAASMAYNVTGTTTAPSSPVAGEVYPIGSGSKATKGEGFEFKVKIESPSSETFTGAIEFDYVVEITIVV